MPMTEHDDEPRCGGTGMIAYWDGSAYAGEGCPGCVDCEGPDDEPTQHWSVSVERNGENVVTIESNCLSGRDISEADAEVIRTAARHLLAFAGEAKSADAVDPVDGIVTG